MEYRDFCSKFCEIEKKYKMFQIDFNGVRYWKYARYYIYNILWKKLYDICVPAWFYGENQSDVGKYSHRYQKFTDKLFHNINIGFKKDVLMFTFPRRVKENQRYVSPVTDEIALHLNRSACIVETPYYGGFYRPSPIFGIKYFDVWDGVGDEKKDYIPISRGNLRKQVLNIFEKEFDIAFTAEEKKIVLTNVNYLIMYRDELMMRYKKVIKKVSPKVVLYTMSYIGEWILLTEVLKEMKIPGVEILHGYVDDNSISYNYSEIGMNDSLPDFIFAYSQVQKDTLNWGIPRSHIRVVGNPWLEERKKKYLAERKEERLKRKITFISSANPVIEKYLVNLADCIDKDKYEIVFKLHPEEYASWRNVYRKLPDCINVIDNNSKDIHYYLANSDFVVGITSTALFEAAIYSVHIYILAEESWQRMHILLNEGRASLVHDGKELFLSIMHDRKIRINANDKFYAKDAASNINNEIEKIIMERGQEC